MQDTSAIDVHTEVFEGPLDLLLYLIKKDNLDIYDIPIAQITQEYLAYLDVIKELNLDTAGEFLLMAATLMQIKVRMLLPSQAESEQEQGPDPRVELSAKLAEYEKYKAAALLLDGKYDAYKDIFYRGSPKFSESDKVLNLELFDLLAAVKRAFDTAEDDGRTLSGELFPIETRIEKIVTLLRERDWVLLDDVFKGEKKRLGIITCFMAMLELIKQRKIFARQDAQFGEIRIYMSKEEPAQETAAPQADETAVHPQSPQTETVNATLAATTESLPGTTPAIEAVETPAHQGLTQEPAQQAQDAAVETVDEAPTPEAAITETEQPAPENIEPQAEAQAHDAPSETTSEIQISEPAAENLSSEAPQEPETSPEPAPAPETSTGNAEQQSSTEAEEKQEPPQGAQ
ncbi:MAG: segregation/condensation protein A [Elusimicrobia bacterium]|nr:segregation/condensation protein A [Elusimicrobiota bacterium]